MSHKDDAVKRILLVSNRTMKQQKEAGFTLIELMIATSVFSVVLLILAAGVIQIGHVYYKGLTESQTQSTVRSIVDAVQQDIQFSGGSTSLGLTGAGGLRGHCIGSRMYEYKLGTLLNGGSGAVLTAGTIGTGCASASIPAALTGRSEMLGQRMRLANFVVEPVPSTNLYRVVVRVVTGEDDLLCSPGAPGGDTCNSGESLRAGERNRTNLQCKNIKAGTQYCAVSEVTVIVERRVSS